MTSTTHINGRTFTRDCDMIDVSMLNSPDEHWVGVDLSGHQHYWTWNGVRGVYPGADKRISAELPTLQFVIDGYTYYEDDDEPHAYGHHECRECGERVYPGYTVRYEHIAGFTSHYIDGLSVSRDVFMAEATAAAKAINIDL